jgi:hypothetical protein
LRDRGYSDSEIVKMTPEEVQAKLSGPKRSDVSDLPQLAEQVPATATEAAQAASKPSEQVEESTPTRVVQVRGLSEETWAIQDADGYKRELFNTKAEALDRFAELTGWPA